MGEIEVQDHVADYYVEKRYKGLGLKYHSRIIHEMMEGIHGKILDVGCGVGIISDLYPKLDIMGIDVSSGMLSNHHGKHLLASADSIPFDNDTFDSIVCRSVLHHLPDVEKALSEIKRVLKPGGKFVCWETNKSWLATLVRRFTQHGDHFSEYHTSFSDLPKLINKHFHNLEIKYQGYIGYPLYGFPDIIDFSSMLGFLFKLFIFLDELFSRSPLKKLGFAIMIKGTK